MEVKILETSLKTVVDGELLNLQQGDVRDVPEASGLEWVALGWAEDLTGNVATGARQPGANGGLEPSTVVQEPA